MFLVVRTPRKTAGPVSDKIWGMTGEVYLGNWIGITVEIEDSR